MKRQTAWFISLGIFLLTARVALLGFGMRRTLAQDRPRPGLSGRLRSNASPQTPTGENTPGSGIKMESLEIAGLKVSVWRPTATGPAPLVVFSHGFHGSSTQSKFLMKALAEAGYLVVAPNHKDAGMGSGGAGLKPETGFGNPGAWSDKTYKDRADDIIALLAAMKADPAWNGKVDWSKVALAGHSLGGYTVLGLAGGWASWKRPEVKAVLALSPYCLPLAQQGGLNTLKIPVMYQGGTRDIGITPSVIKKGGAYDKSAGPTYLVEFEGAGHFAWTDLNPQYQASIAAYSVAFLDKTLRGKSSADLTARRQDVADLRSK